MNTTTGDKMPFQSVFEQQMEDMRLDMREMRAAITEIAKAMSRLAVMEERNLAANQITEKLGLRVERNEANIARIELEQVKFTSTVDGISKTMRFMWAAFGSGVTGGLVFAAVQIIKHFA